MIDELAHSAKLAEADLARSIERLGKLERQIGSDLGELRMLDLSATGDSDLRRKLVAIDDEIRQTQLARQSGQELHSLLVAARQDPGQLLATPNRLLESQPALRRLKDGLVDAQLRTSQLLGTMQPDHPQAVTARLAESEIRRQLHSELEAASRGVEVEQRLAASRLEMLLDERAQLIGRLEKVASLRAEYSSHSSDMKHRTALVEAAQRDLAEARASQAGATASLITPDRSAGSRRSSGGPLRGHHSVGWGGRRLAVRLGPGVPDRPRGRNRFDRSSAFCRQRLPQRPWPIFE